MACAVPNGIVRERAGCLAPVAVRLQLRRVRAFGELFRLRRYMYRYRCVRASMFRMFAYIRRYTGLYNWCTTCRHLRSFNTVRCTNLKLK